MHPIDRIMHVLPLLLLAGSGTITAAAGSTETPQDTVASSIQTAIPGGIEEEGLREKPSEVEVLRERVLTLETRIDALEQRILELTGMLEQMLGDQQNESSEEIEEDPLDPAPPPSPAPATPDQPAQVDPLASPEAVAEALRSQFADEMLKDPSFVLGLNSPDPRAQKEADRVLQSWVRRMEGRYRKRITWPITVEAGRELPNGDWSFNFAVTGREGTPESRPFTQQVPRRIAQRIETWRERPDLSRLLMKGMLEPRLEIIPRKPEPGPYNTEVLVETDEVLISEWVRFEFSVRLTTIIPIFVEERPNAGRPDEDNPEENPDDETR